MIGSLFSGIGGLDLALEWAGFGPTVWQVEIDPWCHAVLAKHWPSAVRFEDVKALSGAALPVADVWCGGFPCQDISSANPSGLGLDGPRSGLWFEFHRLLREAKEAGRRPRGVVVENVGRLARRGLDVVASGLAELGYAVDVSRVLAADVGAPHLRERCFLVAYAPSERRTEPGGERHGGRVAAAVGGGAGDVLADPDGSGRDEQGRRSRERDRGVPAAARGGGALGREPHGCDEGGWREGPSALGNPDGSGLALLPAGGERDEQPAADGAGRSGDGSRACPAPEPRVGRVPHGLPHWVDGAGPGGAWPAPRGAAALAWEPPRTAAEVRARPARLRGLGNAVCPQQGLIAALRLRERLITTREVA